MRFKYQVTIPVEPIFETAALTDIEELLQLYFAVYGKNYPLALGTDGAVMSRMISSPETTWILAREPGKRRIIGSALVDTEPENRIGLLQGVVVDPAYQKGGIGHRMTALLADMVLSVGSVDSVYATTRTRPRGSQLMCLRNGFKPLGILPNAHKLQHYETLALLARFREDALANRHPVERVHAWLEPMVDALRRIADLPVEPEVVHDNIETRAQHAAPDNEELEFICAPHFVNERFLEKFPDPADRFYPFHSPNLLIRPPDGSFEAYAYISKADYYCTLIGVTPGLVEVQDRLDPLFQQLTSFGASYIEALQPLDRFAETSTLLHHGFLPSAVYPAMRRDGDLSRDYVVMSRTAQPLDFRGMSLEGHFKPFVDQYLDLWRKTYLDTLTIFQ